MEMTVFCAFPVVLRVEHFMIVIVILYRNSTIELYLGRLYPVDLSALFTLKCPEARCSEIQFHYSQLQMIMSTHVQALNVTQLVELQTLKHIYLQFHYNTFLYILCACPTATNRKKIEI